MRFSYIVMAAALAVSPVTFADDALQLDLAAKPFGEQKAAVLQSISGDEKYSEITHDKRAEIIKALERISTLLKADASLSSVDDGNREQVLADQEFINGALDEAKRDSRLVCSKETVIGSNMAKRVCRTVAAQKRMYSKTQDEHSGKEQSMQVNTQDK